MKHPTDQLLKTLRFLGGLARETAGNVVIVGWAQTQGVVARMLANGQPDTGFNGLYGAITVAGVKFKDVGLQSTGKIIATAPKTNTNPDFFFARVSLTGQVELTKSYNLNVEEPNGLAMLPNDDFVTVGGYSGAGAPTMARLSGNTLDAVSSYGTSGHVVLPSVSAPFWVIFGVTATPDGKAVAVGNGGASTSWSSFIFRVDAAGKVDTTFASNGLLTFPATGTPKTYLTALSNTVGGRVLVAGRNETQGLVVIRVWN